MNVTNMFEQTIVVFLFLAALVSVAAAQPARTSDLPRVQWAASWLDRFAW